MPAPPLRIRPYSTAIGAEVLGVDLARPLDEPTWTRIHEAFRQHLVLFFRDQRLSPEQHLAFSRRFGTLEAYPFADGMDGYPELVEVVKLPDEVHNFGSGWHVDMSFRETPPLGAALYAIDVPPAGGDTLFANLHLAFETLSPGMQRLLRRLRAVHDSHFYLTFRTTRTPVYRGMKMRRDDPAEVRVHPLVRTHPESARTSLFISPDYCGQLEGMTATESAALLDMLERHATRHEFICRFRWEPGSIALWDNRCVMHNALSDDIGARLHGRGFRRVMRRSTIRARAPTEESDLRASRPGG